MLWGYTSCGLLRWPSIVRRICYDWAMKHLVIAVSLDSSLELLGSFADVITLDKNYSLDSTDIFETVYIRSHFSTPSLQPQVFRGEIEELTQLAKSFNPRVKFIDNMDDVNVIVAFEDKWLQYNSFGDFMPQTLLCGDDADISLLKHPIFKKRLSSRGSGVTWRGEQTVISSESWVAQETLDIKEELRVYAVCKEVCAIGTIRQHMTAAKSTQAVAVRELSPDEIEFSKAIVDRVPGLDLVGLDIARTSEGELKLMEVNRSPGFAKFNELSGINLAKVLYEKF